MASNTASRGLLRSVFTAGSSSWLPAIQALSVQRLPFSSSSRCQAKHVVSFEKSSSKELDEHLEFIRNKVILPSYLPRAQRKRIYSPKYATKLRDDPIEMSIDGRVYRFYHENMFKQPSTKDALWKSIGMMKTYWDWENLPRLLEGLCLHAGRKLKSYDYSRMTRLAGMAGRVDMIIKCASQVNTTGFKINHPETAAELLAWIQKTAIDRNWSAGATQRALMWSERLIDMLEDEKHRRHHSKGVTSITAYPIFRDPQTLAARLHLAAALALANHDGKDIDGKITGKATKYATELVSIWPAGRGLMDLNGPDVYGKGGELAFLVSPQTFLFVASPILRGLEMAAQVVNPLLAEQLQQRIAPVKKEVEERLAIPDLAQDGRGVLMYKAVFEPQQLQEPQDIES